MTPWRVRPLAEEDRSRAQGVVGGRSKWKTTRHRRLAGEVNDPEYARLYREAKAGQRLGQLVYDRRVALGLSQAELAERARMTQPQVSRLETGGGNITVASLRRLARCPGRGSDHRVHASPSRLTMDRWGAARVTARSRPSSMPLRGPASGARAQLRGARNERGHRRQGGLVWGSASTPTPTMASLKAIISAVNRASPRRASAHCSTAPRDQGRRGRVIGVGGVSGAFAIRAPKTILLVLLCALTPGAS
ncbi:helix-turn-helix domain-containing protein [Nonomuraea sp. CA-141351]|uniref:helix-turn-helix domain-containing protein n=1 Tax=Nonomuraea sp. CA-141351 TaxID=3239996 RepID=UPI003D8EE110